MINVGTWVLIGIRSYETVCGGKKQKSGLWEVYNENEEIYEDAGIEKPDTEKEDSPIGFIILAIGLLIFLYYFTREAEI